MKRLHPAFFCLLWLGCPAPESDLHLVGVVERTLVELVAPTSETIIEIDAERGARVERGDVIVRLDPTLLVAEVARAEAALTGARAAAEEAEQEHRRVRRLRREQVASEADLDRARRARDEMAARLREAEAQLIAARKRERELTLVAPVAGVVDQLPFEIGERVPSGSVLAVILQEADPWVRVWVPETAVSVIGPGTGAEIRVDGISATLRGAVLDVAHEPEFTPHFALTERDRVHLVYETRVRIHAAPKGLRPGLPAEVWLRPEAPQS